MSDDRQPATNQLLLRALAHHCAGECESAKENYKNFLEVEPDHAVANHNLGLLLVQQGKALEGLPYFIAALNADATQGQYWLSYIDALQQAGRLDEAREVLGLARQYGLSGDQVDSLAGRLGLAVERKNMPSAAPAPQEMDELVALFGQGKYQEVGRVARLMTENYPQHGFGWKMLGSAIRSSREALVPMQKAALLLPNDFEVHYNLGQVLQELGRIEEACDCYMRALQINPNFAQGLNNLGVVFHQLGKLNEAEASYRRALTIQPDYLSALHNLGVVLQFLGKLDEAYAAHVRALQINPEHAESHCNTGITLLRIGKTADAEKAFRRALKIQPDYTLAHCNLILCLDVSDTTNMEMLQNERLKWAELHAMHLRENEKYEYANNRSPDRKLRIGYVSADFREHSASKVFGSMLTLFDRSQFEVFAYSNFKVMGDRFTDRFRKNVTVWRDIANVPDDTTAQMIREDQIDILVDLSGFTAGNRLLVFARKPAPIQVTAWGYATGTGMSAMDVFFSDTVMVPSEEKSLYKEEVRYLPCALCASFMDEPFPEVSGLPALSRGVITFGSLNRLAKLSDSTCNLWAKILLAIPQSRLLLKTPELDDVAARERIVDQFMQYGVGKDRLIMKGKSGWFEHMQTYNEIDIVLDPFPQGGGVTALEGMMMGVPLVTLLWPTMAGRISASFLTVFGLTEWIAKTQEEYVEIAVKKSRNLQVLTQLRQQLRRIFTSSIIGDQGAYVRIVEQQYRQLWREWCAKEARK